MYIKKYGRSGLERHWCAKENPKSASISIHCGYERGRNFYTPFAPSCCTCHYSSQNRFRVINCCSLAQLRKIANNENFLIYNHFIKFPTPNAQKSMHYCTSSEQLVNLFQFQTALHWSEILYQFRNGKSIWKLHRLANCAVHISDDWWVKDIRVLGIISRNILKLFSATSSTS